MKPEPTTVKPLLVSYHVPEFLEVFNRQVIGYEKLGQSISKRLLNKNQGLLPATRPIGSWFLAGPTGVGKTHIVRSVAKALHGNAKQYLHINCGEYTLSHYVAKLIGAPAGYLGHGSTAPVFNVPKISSLSSERCLATIILFDEIEKAHPELYDLLLSILWDAEIQNGNGETVNFSHCLIFFTSNIGATRKTTGFQVTDRAVIKKQSYQEAIKEHFRPEFLNRIDYIYVCNELTEDQVRLIIKKEINDLECRIRDRQRKIEDDKILPGTSIVSLTPEAEEYLVRASHSNQYGAREILRHIYGGSNIEETGNSIIDAFREFFEQNPNVYYPFVIDRDRDTWVVKAGNVG